MVLIVDLGFRGAKDFWRVLRSKVKSPSDELFLHAPSIIDQLTVELKCNDQRSATKKWPSKTGALPTEG